jgi:hypothetical protein
MRVKLYHVTDAAAAEAISRDGFRDGEGHAGTASTWPRGVVVSNEPLTVYEGAPGDEVVEVAVPDSRPPAAEFLESVTGYRQWCVSADLLNKWPRRRLDAADVEALEADRVRQPGPSADLLAEFVRLRGNPFGDPE